MNIDRFGSMPCPIECFSNSKIRPARQNGAAAVKVCI